MLRSSLRLPHAAPWAPARVVHKSLCVGSVSLNGLSSLLPQYGTIASASLPTVRLAALHSRCSTLLTSGPVRAFSDIVKKDGGGDAAVMTEEDTRLKEAAMHVGLAEVYQRRGDTQKQRQHLELAMQASPSNKAVRLSLAELHIRGKQYRDAVRHLDFILLSDPACAVTRTLLKNVYLGEALDAATMSDAHSAIQAYQRYLEAADDASGSDAQVTEVYFNLGALYERVGDSTEALNSYRTASERDAGHWRSRVALGGLCHRVGVATASGALLDEAIQVYHQALDIDACKEKDRVNYGLGLLYVAKQEGERAGEKFRAAVTLNPRLKEARLELATVLLSQGNPGGAVYQLEEALAIDPDYGAARHNLKQIQGRLKAEEESLKDKAKAAGGGSGGAEGELDVNKLDVRTRDALQAVGRAELAGRNGDLATAIREYNKHLPTIAAIADKYPMLQEGIGAAYWNQVTPFFSVSALL